MTNKKRIDLLREYWGKEVVDDIITAIVADYPQTMTFSEFLSYCTTCDDWREMLLSGVNKLFPHVRKAIPNNMGIRAWSCLHATIALCGVQLED